ncbi:MAG: DNA polymerase III subunit gamma/tau [bacterium]|nr:DNA polymerase III subunit gamma/tau [bacterium]
MPYQVLARKWRPQVFEDVIGQNHITDVLKNSLESGRLHHGYLFIGIRGIGKTTSARILAKSLNCVDGPTSQPCNHCEFCREITEGYSMDVVEIDGASNRGVDEVRILQENVGYAPSRSRYKIFIIDEVHMLTTPAFNALLKTLEEPPSNVVFIMATTEPWKIPPTILSRCQQFKFKNGSSEQVSRLLKKISQHEGVTISDAGVSLLTKSAGGSVRDAENLLDQAIGFCGNQVEDRDVRYVLGIPDLSLLHEFLTVIFAHQTAHIFPLMERLVGEGHNLRLFCMELMERVRNLMVLKLAKQADRYLSLFDYSREDLEPFAARVTQSELQQLYWLLVETERNIKFSPNPRFVLEMSLTAMTKLQPLTPIANVQKQLQDIQTTLTESVPMESVPTDKASMSFVGSTVAQAVPVSQEQRHAQQAQPLPPADVLRSWNEILMRVKQKRPSLGAILKKGLPVELNQHELTIGFHMDADFSRKALDDPKKTAIIAEVLKDFLGRTVKISTTVHSGAMSLDVMRQQLEEQAEPIPRPEPASSQTQASPPPERRSPKRKAASMPERRPSERQAKPQGGGNSNWQNRGAQRSQYKPRVQVSVQDLARMFDGEIEE